jgi:serine protease DegQ
MTISARRHYSGLVGLAVMLATLHAPGAVAQQQGASVEARSAAAADPRTITGIPSLAPIIERVSASVVNISVTGARSQVSDELFRRFLPEIPDDQPRQGAGSGVIVDASNGYILTNHHVIESADRIIITLLDNRSYEASVVGSDEGSDIAVLRIDAGNLSQIALAEPDNVRVGDYVLAIGNPFSLSHTVTSGIVSGLGRSGINRDGYEDFIQTDASINPGNSGGALINLRGELVGVNSAILSRGGGNIGIGFAIPVKTAQSVMTQLIEHGEVRRGRLGVYIQPVTPDSAMMYGLSETAGALVTQITRGSAAEEAGLAVEDVIISIDGRPTADAAALRHAIGLRRPGETVDVGFIRNGERRSVTAVLGDEQAAAVAAARQERAQPERPAPQEMTDIDPAFRGAQFATHDASAADFRGVEGVLVATVESGSRAWSSGLRPGDIITNVNRQRVQSVDDIREIARSARSILLLVQRGSQSQLLQMR